MKFAASTGAVTVSVVDTAVPLNVAVMLTAVDAPTAVVVTVNVALVAPAFTVTDPGHDRCSAVARKRYRGAALDGARLNVTVPVTAPPPPTLVGLTLTLVSVGVWGGGVTVSSPPHATAKDETAIAMVPAAIQRFNSDDGVMEQPPQDAR